MRRGIGPERGAEPLVGALMGDEAPADLAVLLGRGLEHEPAIEAQRHQQRRAAAARGKRVEPGSRGQIEERRGAHTGDPVAAGQAVAREFAGTQA